jgi:hypothetical protein
VLFRTFGWSLGLTVLVLAGAGLIGGPEVVALVAILAVLEVSLSFDNAVVNATVLQKMTPLWQKIFLTVGIAIAVFGMRLVFPLLIVAVTANLAPQEALDLALNDKDAYQAKMLSAHPAIAAFGGIFLMMITLDFLFEEREINWIGPLERGLARVGRLGTLSAILALVTLLGLAQWVPQEDSEQVLIAGVAGVATYLAVAGLSALFEESDDDDDIVATPKGSGEPHVRVPDSVVKGGLYSFLYLEMLDASFSFDGVIGAFAVTNDIFIIAAGLGVGALYVRSMTVWLVRQGTLAQYVHLEHGAHYAIGALAVLLFISIQIDVHELVTGLIGVGFIGLSLLTSILLNRRNAVTADVEGVFHSADTDTTTRV